MMDNIILISLEKAITTRQASVQQTIGVGTKLKYGKSTIYYGDCVRHIIDYVFVFFKCNLSICFYVQVDNLFFYVVRMCELCMSLILHKN